VNLTLEWSPQVTDDVRVRHLVSGWGVNETELLEQIQAGDKAACAMCVELHAPAVYRLALRMMGDPEEAEDVMQETFLNAFRTIESFEGRSGLATWLFRIANNVALMRLRKRQPLFVQIDPHGGRRRRSDAGATVRLVLSAGGGLCHRRGAERTGAGDHGAAAGAARGLRPA
jgi:hypothetical protein